MGASPITVTALTATPTLRGNKLTATVSATGPAANIPSLMLANVEFHSSTTNDRATATKAVEGNPEALHNQLIEETTYYYWSRVRAVNGDLGDWFPASATAGVACTAIGMSGLAFGLANGRLVATVGSNALTVAIKTAAGTDPSASDPVYIAFRNPTLATGNYQIRAITAALSLTISNGSTLSTTDNTPFRLWVVLFDDAGTLRLGAQNCFTGFNLYPLTEDGVASSTAEGGAGAADSAGVIYTAAAVTSKPYRALGYMDWSSGLATAGAWSSAPDTIQMHSIGGKMPGEVVQDITEIRSLASSGSTTIPFDGTEPQISEGVNWRSPNFTPKAKMNRLLIEATVHCTHSVSGTEITLALFQNTQASPTANADAIACGWSWVPTADAPTAVHVFYVGYCLLTDPLVFQIRVGGADAGTIYINRTAADNLGMAGVLKSHYRVAEIMG